ncbi:ATP-binding protein [Spirosoma migulaei]
MLLFLLGVCLQVQAQKIDSLQKQLARTRLDTHRVHTLYELSYAYWLGGDDSLAIFYGIQSARLAKRLGFLQGEGKARLRLVRIEADRLVDVQGAFAQLDTIRLISIKLKDRHMEAESYIRKAQLLEGNLTRQKEIMPLLDKANAIFIDLNDKPWQGTVFNEKAQIFARSGQFSKSVELYLKARQLQEEANDLAGLRSTLPNLGVVYSALGLYTEALKIFDEAAIVAKKRNDKLLEAFLLNQRADIFEKEGKYSAALTALSEAETINKAIHAVYSLPKVYARMGKVYIKRKDYENALKFTQLGDKLYRDAVDLGDFVDHMVQLNYGKIYLAKKQYNRVLSYAAKGLAFAEESDPPLLAEAAEYHWLLAQSYEATNRTDKALFHYKKFKMASDSLLNKESLQKATASAMNYEFDKQRQQTKLSLQTLKNDKLTQARNFLVGLSALAILLAGIIFWSNRKLTAKNHELTVKNREIEEALFKGQSIERKRVASELHDNLNTKLAALRWRMEAWDVSDYNEEDRKFYAGLIQMLEDVYSDVRQISHNLLPTELQTQGLASALQTLTDKLNFNPHMQFSLDKSGLKKRPDSKIEFELYHVVLELINNSIKHSQADQVVLSLTQNARKILLSVSDNGVGFTIDPQANGIGMRNILARVDTLEGTCRIESSPGHGTRVEIEVPA